MLPPESNLDAKLLLLLLLLLNNSKTSELPELRWEECGAVFKGLDPMSRFLCSPLIDHSLKLNKILKVVLSLVAIGIQYYNLFGSTGKLIWPDDRSCLFTIKRAYWLLHNEYLDGRSIIQRYSSQMWAALWKMILPMTCAMWDAANTWKVDAAFKPPNVLFSCFLGSIAHDHILEIIYC
ncbi:hypothetical protein CMV_007956 [Castanea mollissima]|uniref:Wax synthase domain-containing protein n=1 Tax=Castanea mollissima TaxID=60419 RepID=A0A8J4VZX2_9ROSI|nr:hypothetical protein CMV_007956 [Castanea mollissima]